MSDLCRTCKPSLLCYTKIIPFKIQEAAEKGHTECMEVLLQMQGILSSSPNDIHSKLVKAARKGQFGLVKLLFRCKLWFLHDLQQPLCEAMSRGYIHIMEYLIASAVNDEGQTPLILATMKEDENMVKSVLQAGADVNRHNDFTGTTALEEAALNGCTEIAIMLIEAGAGVEVLDTLHDRNKLGFQSQTALLYCVLKNSQKGVRMLAEAGADLNKVDESGDTALMVAARKGYLNITKALIETGADVNLFGESGDTALMVAARNEHLDITKILIEAGADVNKICARNETALLQFALKGNMKGVQLLLRLGARVNIGRQLIGTAEAYMRLLLDAAGQKANIGITPVTTPNIGLLLTVAGEQWIILGGNKEIHNDTLHHRCRVAIRETSAETRST